MGYVGDKGGEAFKDFTIFSIIVSGKSHLLVDAGEIWQVHEVDLCHFWQRLAKEAFLGVGCGIEQPDLETGLCRKEQTCDHFRVVGLSDDFLPNGRTNFARKQIK